jgi:5-methylcytosine-specific restriction endonuclease McrA
MSSFLAALRFTIEAVCVIYCLGFLVVVSDAAGRSSGEQSAQAEHIAELARSPEWREVRNKHIQANGECIACGSRDELQVHHVLPFRLWPEHELDPGNLVTLCQRCHIVFGHLGNTRAFNPLVRQDAARYLARVKARPDTKFKADHFKVRFATAP